MDNRKKEILEALEVHNGIVSVACKNIGLPRSTFYLWCSDDDEFKKAVDELQEVSIDHVESKLFERINSGDTTATIFYLKTKGKKRGYVEKTETEVSGNMGFTWNEVRNYQKPNELQ